MTLKKKHVATMFVFGAVLVAGSLMVGHTQAQRDITYSLIGTCELPQDVTEAEGWDIDPTSGNWGGKDESQFAVAWPPGAPDLPAPSGREASCTIPGLNAYLPKTVTIHTLNGMGNDDFCVFVDVSGDDVRVGCYDETNATEEWVATQLTLPVRKLVVGQDITIRILATGNAWPGFNSYGQLAVDYIEVRGLEVAPRPR